MMNREVTEVVDFIRLHQYRGFSLSINLHVLVELALRGRTKDELMRLLDKGEDEQPHDVPDSDAEWMKKPLTCSVCGAKEDANGWSGSGNSIARAVYMCRRCADSRFRTHLRPAMIFRTQE